MASARGAHPWKVVPRRHQRHEKGDSMPRRIVCCLVALLCWIPASAMAQSTAALSGTAVDESKAVLPGVTVAATETSNGRQYVAVTDERGEYRMPAVLPGMYKMQAELSSFATIVMPSVELLVGQSATVPFVMKVATRAETVTITGEAPLLNTQAAVV